MDIMYACVAAIGGIGGGRCRHFVLWPQTLCEGHQSWQPAPQPDIVRICFSLQKLEWSRELQGAGIPRGGAKDRHAQAKQVEVHARQYGHEAYAYRRDFPDSGTLVFYTLEPGIPDAESLRQGLKNVSLWETFRELLEIYDLGGIFIEPREKKTDRLIISFYKEWVGPPVSQEVSVEGIMRLLEKFVSSWSVHIYANPPRPDGKIVHTVNAHGRKEESILTLRFNHGLWGVE